QLDFPELEQQTKIRSKYLQALEDEHFDVLPAPTYVKGFLRNYADALGLEGQLYVDEYNSRFVTGEEETPLRPRDYQRRPRPQSYGPRFQTRAVVLVLGAIAGVVVLVIVAAKFGSNDNPKVPGLNTTGTSAARERHRAAPRPMARLVLTATNGDSWVLVRAGGVQRFQGTITQGHQLAFTRKPNLYRSIWFAASKPQNLVARLNGRIVVIPGAARGKPEQLIVTTKTIRRASPST
ncbi:MAG TPA: helix-turn-helix domain-containing protein, partial [Gaiellaceae bacterium]